MSKKVVERYPKTQFAFYRMHNKRALCRALGISRRKLDYLLDNKNYYYYHKKEKINGKIREIRVPISTLRSVHERMKGLFNRIQRPEYLHSPRNERSYVTNAAQHMYGIEFATIDIKQFYPSTTSEHVFRYCFYEMEMSSDIAGLITKLCTYEERLPFGSPLSPILGFHVHREMFDQIYRVCVDNDLTLTVYVDDISVSGPHIPEGVIHSIKKIIRRENLRYHKHKRRHQNNGVNITGVNVSRSGSSPDNKANLKMRQILDEIDCADEDYERARLIQSAIGVNRNIINLYSDGYKAKERAKRRHAWLCTSLKLVQASLSENSGSVTTDSNDESPL